MKRNGNREASIQASVIQYIRTCAHDTLVFAIANGGLRTKAEAARLKWTGVLAGIPDLCGITPEGRVFFLEVKPPEGRLSRDQHIILTWLTDHGVWCAVVRSIDDVREAFARWGILTRESRP